MLEEALGTKFDRDGLRRRQRDRFGDGAHEVVCRSFTTAAYFAQSLPYMAQNFVRYSCKPVRSATAVADTPCWVISGRIQTSDLGDVVTVMLGSGELGRPIVTSSDARNGEGFARGLHESMAIPRCWRTPPRTS
jgi:hypothetical protein